jgi:hypothetical protein
MARKQTPQNELLGFLTNTIFIPKAFLGVVDEIISDRTVVSSESSVHFQMLDK